MAKDISWSRRPLPPDSAWCEKAFEKPGVKDYSARRVGTGSATADGHVARSQAVDLRELEGVLQKVLTISPLW